MFVVSKEEWMEFNQIGFSFSDSRRECGRGCACERGCACAHSHEIMSDLANNIFTKRHDFEN